MDDILKLLHHNARMTHADIATALDRPEAEISAAITDYEARGIIRGYHAILDVDALPSRGVRAVIEVNLQPEREGGFNRTAMRISKFPEVSSAHLMSGSHDLLLFVEGETLQDVAGFVSEKLATMPGVKGTATSFMLKTYKHRGLLMHKEEGDERLKVSP